MNTDLIRSGLIAALTPRPQIFQIWYCDGYCGRTVKHSSEEVRMPYGWREVDGFEVCPECAVRMERKPTPPDPCACGNRPSKET